ncbi:hypothetical protein PR048_008229 [Dryococelus australis]|uniref:Uncharacterized protein n=1 Tax=Dryococelus australis TaxID=614101 RepID=A0ABQ9HWI6_9NEOP|nr:hypothetical protein PR048_008229 [Dryococelus australis]
MDSITPYRPMSYRLQPLDEFFLSMRECLLTKISFIMTYYRAIPSPYPIPKIGIVPFPEDASPVRKEFMLEENISKNTRHVTLKKTITCRKILETLSSEEGSASDENICDDNECDDIDEVEEKCLASDEFGYTRIEPKNLWFEGTLKSEVSEVACKQRIPVRTAEMSTCWLTW